MGEQWRRKRDRKERKRKERKEGGKGKREGERKGIKERKAKPNHNLSTVCFFRNGQMTTKNSVMLFYQQ